MSASEGILRLSSVGQKGPFVPRVLLQAVLSWLPAARVPTRVKPTPSLANTRTGSVAAVTRESARRVDADSVTRAAESRRSRVSRRALCACKGVAGAVAQAVTDWERIVLCRGTVAIESGCATKDDQHGRALVSLTHHDVTRPVQTARALCGACSTTAHTRRRRVLCFSRNGCRWAGDNTNAINSPTHQRTDKHDGSIACHNHPATHVERSHTKPNFRPN
jgi:hypothetical protein